MAAAATPGGRAFLLQATPRRVQARVRQSLPEHREDSSSAAGEAHACRWSRDKKATREDDFRREQMQAVGDRLGVFA